MSYIMGLRQYIGSQPIIMTCGATLVVNENSEILLQQRTDNELWGIPGGAMELGETFEDAAKRELFEETNLVAKKLELFQTFSGESMYHRYPNGHEVYVAVALFLCREYEGNMKCDPEETKALRFFNIHELPVAELHPPDKGVLRTVREAVEEGTLIV